LLVAELIAGGGGRPLHCFDGVGLEMFQAEGMRWLRRAAGSVSKRDVCWTAPIEQD
jgi:hypothetical protein